MPDIPQPPVTFRSFDDIPGQRKAIYDNVLSSVKAAFPIKNATHQLDVIDAQYEDYNPTKADEKKAVLTDGRMLRKLHGTVRLTELATGKVLDEQKTTLAHVPHLTNRGTFMLDGTSWVVRNQARLRPGVYVRQQKSGGTEAHFNVKPGTGRGYRVELEPESGVFKLNVGQSTTRLYPLLRSLGVKDEELQDAWGKELFDKNYRKTGKNDLSDIKKVIGKLGKDGLVVDDATAPQLLKELLGKHEYDEDTTELTLGSRLKNLDNAAMLGVTKKILKVARDESPGDVRDSQAFQSIHSAEDFFSDRVKRDPTGTLRKLLWKSSKTGKLESTGGVFSQALRSLFNGTGLAATPEETNELEIADLRQGVTRMGDGGISDTSAVSRDAKGIQPSYLGLIDSSRSPESLKIGLDLRLARNAVKGSDGQLYAQMRNVKTGQMEFVPARKTERVVVALPGELSEPGKRIRGIKDGKVQYVHRDEVVYELPHGGDMMSTITAMVPFPQAMKGQRLAMAARMTAQALPIRGAEAPLVQGALPDGTSLNDVMSERVGAVKSTHAGQVVKVTPDEITVKTSEGLKTFETYNHYPGSRKTFLHNTAVVKPGDTVSPGQLLAHSNMTDTKGQVALGRNLRVGYVSAKGATHEDGFVISESAAIKLSSEQAYQMELEGDGVKNADKDKYVAVYGPRFTKDQYSKLGTDGIIKPGTIVKSGDPLILAIGQKDGRAVGAVMKTAKSGATDRAVIWEHAADGEVVDIKKTKGGMTVFVKSYTPSTVADKLSMRYGNKGVISEIRPDAQMPHDEQGRPLEVLLNPVGVISRVNPAVLVEGLLGKIAEKTGKPYVVAPFSHDNAAEFALGEAAKHGVSELETLTDPETGRKLQNIFTGTMHVMKTHHLAESKLSARDQAAYDSFDAPAKGGATGAKRLSLLGLHSLVSAGATEFIKDAKLVRGQRNDEYWRSIREGVEPLQPAKNFANDHFRALLKGAGVNVRESGNKSRLSPMLDKDVAEIAPHEIDSGKTFDQDMKPVPGGLFDLGKTGGADGTRFSYIQLPAKIPHPMFVEPIARVLGLTLKGLDAVLSGKQELHGKTGPDAIEGALSDVNIAREIEHHKQIIKTGSASKRDSAVRALGFLEGFKRMEITPSDLMISKIPVIPPKFRPITRTPKMDVVHDLNHLYHDLIESKTNFSGTKDKLGEAGDQYLTMMNAAKAVVGTGDPVNPEHKEQELKGLLGFAIGVGESPKCYDDATEILTEDGWVSFSELGEHHGKVATLNPESSTFEWEMPTSYVHQPYNGVMVHSLSGKIDSLVTPNHQHWIARREKSARSSAQFPTFRKIYAGALPQSIGRAHVQVAASNWNGHTPRYVFNNVQPDRVLFARFVGWWLAEGWTHQDGSTAYICQTAANPEYVRELTELTTQLGFRHSIRSYDKRCTTPNGKKHEIIVTYFAIHSKELCDWLVSNCGTDCFSKHIPREVRNWEKPHLRELFKSFLSGDGGKHGSTRVLSNRKTFKSRDSITDVKNRYSSSSLRLVNDFSEVLAKLGFMQSAVAARQPSSATHSVHYTVHISAWRFVVLDPNVKHVYELYSGGVHCVTVPNGLLFTRRNGKILVSGNSATFQRRVLGMSLDTVGRSVVSADPSLGMDEIGLPNDMAWEIYKPFIIRRLTRNGTPATEAVTAVRDRSPQAKHALEAEVKERPVVYNRDPSLHRYAMQAGWARLHDGNSIKTNSSVLTDTGMDYDGDAISVHVPSSDRSVKDVLENLLPSKQAISSSSFEVHHDPKQDYVAGLYLAGKPDMKRPVKDFATKEAAIAAYKRGELSARDPVRILS